MLECFSCVGIVSNNGYWERVKPDKRNLPKVFASFTEEKENWKRRNDEPFASGASFLFGRKSSCQSVPKDQSSRRESTPHGLAHRKPQLPALQICLPHLCVSLEIAQPSQQYSCNCLNTFLEQTQPQKSCFLCVDAHLTAVTCCSSNEGRWHIRWSSSELFTRMLCWWICANLKAAFAN